MVAYREEEDIKKLQVASMAKKLWITAKTRHGMSYKKGDVLLVNFP